MSFWIHFIHEISYCLFFALAVSSPESNCVLSETKVASAGLSFSWWWYFMNDALWGDILISVPVVTVWHWNIFLILASKANSLITHLVCVLTSIVFHLKPRSPVQTSPFYGDDDDKRCHVVIKMMVKFITYVW